MDSLQEISAFAAGRRIAQWRTNKMLAYHGTSAIVALKSLEEGLLPRSVSKAATNWQAHPSRADLVYLSVLYAPYFALCSTSGIVGIVEVDVSKLDEECLLPDEDFIEQVERGQSGSKRHRVIPPRMNISSRTKWVRDRLTKFAHHWKDSVVGLGNFAHKGVIGPHAITRVATFDPKSNHLITAAAFDPTITVLNAMICGDKYRELTRWFFDSEADFEKVCFGQGASPEEVERMVGVENYVHNMMSMFSKRDGLKVYDGKASRG